ncbi:MAG: hypothetical protein ACYCTE_12495 [Acidimicrobiales bacterium]
MPIPTAPNAESTTTPLGTPTTPDGAHAIGRFLPAGLDGLRQMFRQTVQACDRDITLMRASQRWRPGQADPESYVPGDVPAMRATLAGTNLNVAATMLRRLGPTRASSPELAGDVLELVELHVAAPMLVYQAAPFFVSGELALAASASDRPPAGLVDDICLPFPSIWIVFGHDLELPADMAWPAKTNFDIAPYVREMASPAIGAWQRNIAGALHDRGGALCGVVVFAGPDGVGLADEVIWTVSANPDTGMPPPQDLDRQRGALVGARSRALLAPVVDNLALLVATTPWSDTPAVAPGIGTPDSERWRRSLERAKAQRALARGAGSGVRVVEARSTARTPARGEPHDHAGAGREVSPHARRGHWRRSRVATRGPDGQIVGDVHGEHGTDWRYVGHWIAPTLIHPDRAGGVMQVWRLEQPIEQSTEQPDEVAQEQQVKE